MQDDTLRRTMLFDFFGEVLTEKQKEYFYLHYNGDLSLAEIARQYGVSRQGVWDIIRRAEAALIELEEKTGLILRHEQRRELVARILADLKLLSGMTDGEAENLTRRIADEVEKLKIL